MLKKEKKRLPATLFQISLKLKSYAFMKIFMAQRRSPKKYQKLRHYDLQLQGATAIASCIKKKLQQIYLRSFYQLKNTLKVQKIKQQCSFQSFKTIKSEQNIKKTFPRYKAQTDRQTYNNSQNVKPPAKLNTKQKSQKSQVKLRQYKSQYGGQSQLSQNSKRSNLQALLNKVRQVNCQSKTQKQNLSKNNNYSASYQNSRIKSAYGGAYSLNGGNNGKYSQFNHKQKSYHNNDMSFCTHGLQRQKITKRSNFQAPPIDRKQTSIDKSNLMSLKKWHKNQKRTMIMNKILELQSSLLHKNHKPEQEHYLDNNPSQQTHIQYEYYQDPNNYLYSNHSQAYLNYRARQPARSVMDIKVRDEARGFHNRNY